MNRDYLKHLGFTQKAITMSNKKMTRTEFYKGIMNLENYAPKKAPTQLPAELVSQIEKEAEVYSENNADLLRNIIEYNTFNDLNSGYIAGATAYAVKLQEAQQEIEELKLKIARNHNLSTEWLKATTERDDAKQLLEQVIASNSKIGVVSDGIINEIKTFLDGK